VVKVAVVATAAATTPGMGPPALWGPNTTIAAGSGHSSGTGDAPKPIAAAALDSGMGPPATLGPNATTAITTSGSGSGSQSIIDSHGDGVACLTTVELIPLNNLNQPTLSCNDPDNGYTMITSQNDCQAYSDSSAIPVDTLDINAPPDLVTPVNTWRGGCFVASNKVYFNHNPLALAAIAPGSSHGYENHRAVCCVALNDKSSSKSKLSAGVWVGIAAGILFAVILIYMLLVNYTSFPGIGELLSSGSSSTAYASFL